MTSTIKNTCAVCEKPQAKPPFEVCWVCAARSREEREKNPINPDFREWLLDRDGHRCVECGSVDRLEIDHIVPILYGGKTTPDNLQTLCHDCNMEKSADPLYLAGQAHRLSQPPVVIWQPLIKELGGLIPAAIISEAIGQPGLYKFGETFDPSEWATRLGLSLETLLLYLEWLQEANLIRYGLKGDQLWIAVWADLCTSGIHPPQASSTGRPS